MLILITPGTEGAVASELASAGEADHCRRAQTIPRPVMASTEKVARTQGALGTVSAGNQLRSRNVSGACETGFRCVEVASLLSLCLLCWLWPVEVILRVVRGPPGRWLSHLLILAAQLSILMPQLLSW